MVGRRRSRHIAAAMLDLLIARRPFAGPSPDQKGIPLPAVNSVLVVGGGSAGNVTALMLRRAGVGVDLVDIDPDWSTLGSGITLGGNALRVLDWAGVWGEVKQHLVPIPPHLDFVKPGGPDYPGVVGMYRPTLQLILSNAVRASGTDIRLGVTVTSLEEIGDKVHVTFTDGSTRGYDLVVAADGINSAVRDLIGITTKPRRLDLAIWRVYVERPEDAAINIAHGGEVFPVMGMNLTTDTHMYSYVVERSRDIEVIRALDKVKEVYRIATLLPEPYRSAFESVTDASQVDYRSFHELDLGLDCYRGRVVVIGDAAHVCPPTVAQGAAMALEDAAVLSELLTGAAKFDDELLRTYAERRQPRVADIVRTSVQLCTDYLDAENASAAFMAAMQRLAPGMARLP